MSISSINCSVYDLDLDAANNTVEGILAVQDGVNTRIPVRKEDYVFLTCGSMMTNARFGDNTHTAETCRDQEHMGLFTIWKNLAAKDEKFGHPEKFLSFIDKSKFMTFFLTVKDYPEFFERLERKTGSRPGTGGCITVMDSGWDLSLFVYDRDYFPNQKANNEDVMFCYGLFGERDGNYIKKPMAECTGDEMILETLYHLDMLDIKDEVLAHTHVSTCMMPYITAHFMPRREIDRPRIIPEGCTNLALMGQYVEVPGDVSFTIETSVSTPLHAVYALTGLDKTPIDVYPSRYDIRYTLERVKKFAGIRGEVTEDALPRINPMKAAKELPKIKEGLIHFVNNVPPYDIKYAGRDKSVALKDSVLNPEFPKTCD